ncbi:MAG: FCD domain-containing protein [Myxococcota bacterium]
MTGVGKDKPARVPLSVSVSRTLRDSILAGDFPTGAPLPSELELTKLLGVGRSTVREAVRILQAQGMVTGGDTVSTQRPRVSPELLKDSAEQAMEAALRLGSIPLDDLVRLRVVIEGASIEAAARAQAPAAMRAAEGALEDMRTAGTNAERFSAADHRFHRALAEASGNSAFPLVLAVLRRAITGFLSHALARSSAPGTTMRALVREHEQLLGAVGQGQGRRARDLVTAHIEGFYENPEEGRHDA